MPQITEEKKNTGWLASASADIAAVQSILQERYGDYIPLAYVHTFGCQQNVSDGEKIKGILALLGYGFTDTPDEARLILLNTCAVREHAEERVFGTIGAYKALKKKHPDLKIGLCGCMTQQEHIAEKIKKSYPQVDLVFGTNALDRLPHLLRQVLGEPTRVIDLKASVGITEGIPVKREENGFQAWLPIMYGCNNFCTYCVVPYVRGREVSRKSADILAEFTELVNSGVKEITLLGQNVNSYGKGLDEDINFSKLLRKLNAVEGDFRIRFMTSHPKDATFELIDTIAECEKMSAHFHLPVQSGSDTILAQMNRHYTVEQYLRLIDYARERIPNIAFTSDIIVGFPGETEEDFQKTLRLMEYVRFDSVFSFIYSKRVGTKAAEMEDPTPPEEKTDRIQRLLALQREIGNGRCQDYVGKICRVLAEGPGRNEGMLTGRNEGYMLVDFPGTPDQIGQFVDVKVTKALGWALVGEPIANQPEL